MTIDLVAYFTDRLQAAKSALEPVAELRRKKEQDGVLQTRLRAERQEEASFQAQAAGKGLAVESIATKIEELDRQIAELDRMAIDTESRIRGLMESTGNRALADCQIAQRELNLAELLAEDGWYKAVVAKRGDQLPGIVVEIGNHGPGSGDEFDYEVRLVDVILGRCVLKNLPVKPGSGRYRDSDPPGAISWAFSRGPSRALWAQPAGSNSAKRRGTTRDDGDNEKLAYVFEETCEILLPTDLINSGRNADGGAESTLSRYLAAPYPNWRVLDAATVLKSELSEAGGAIDIASPEGGPLLLCIKAAIRNLGSGKPPFEPAPGPIPSGEIEKKIEKHWRRLADSPWSGAIGGDLASLKFNVERGEQARFWVGVCKGHYGFRLRTRDHSWLMGELYVPPESDPSHEHDGGVLRVLRHGSTDATHTIATVGDMTLRVREVRD